MFRPPSGAFFLNFCLRYDFHNFSQRLLLGVLVRGGDETLEQRMRLVRLAQKLRVKLARDEKRMVLEFNDFDQLAVGRQAAEHEPGLLEFFTVGVVEFVAVTVAFVDHE